jgi:hypothetical protein
MPWEGTFLFQKIIGFATQSELMQVNVAASFMIYSTQSVSSLSLQLAGIAGHLMNHCATDDIAIRMPMDASLGSAPGYAGR